MPKVLLAEDDLTMVSLLTTLLKIEGFEVVAAEVEEDIPAVVHREHPDVLFLDVHLGHQSGLEILDALRRDETTRDVRVIMTSGMNLKEDCLARGANAFLLKPYMPDELVATLKKVIATA
ncbi:MAG: response regulator [Gammaproteobacteria bacterium]